MRHHPVTVGAALRRAARRAGAALTPRIRPRARAKAVVDDAYYTACYAFALESSGLTAEEHFWRHGLERGFMPREDFDPCVFAIRRQAGSVAQALQSARKTHLLEPCGMDGLLPHLPAIAEDAYLNFNIENALERREHPDELRKNREAAPHYAEAKTVAFDKEAFPFRLQVPAEQTIMDFLRGDAGGAILKLPHGFWDAAEFVSYLSSQLAERFTCLNGEQRHALAKRWAAALYPANGVFVEGFCEEMAQLLSAEKEARAGVRHIGLALKGYPTWDERLLHIPGEFPDYVGRRVANLSQYFAADYPFWDGTLFKRWAITGTLSRIMAELRERPVLLVASDLFAPLPQRLGLAQAEHYVIPRAKTHLIRYRVLAELTRHIERQHRETGQWPVVVAQAGGSLSFWLLQKLCARFPQLKCMDFGQTLNIWMLDSCGILPWLRVYAGEIIQNNALEAYYARIGKQEALERLRDMRW